MQRGVSDGTADINVPNALAHTRMNNGKRHTVVKKTGINDN